MTSLDLPAARAAAPTVTTPVGSERCEMCSHPMNKHDGIATRYCSATQSNALSRRCICPR